MACARAEVDLVELNQYEDLMQTEPSLFPPLLSTLATEGRTARVALTMVMTKLMSRPLGVSATFILR